LFGHDDRLYNWSDRFNNGCGGSDSSDGLDSDDRSFFDC
jgi:hypothetical protein